MVSSLSSYRKKHYQKAFSQHGESPRSLQWANYRAAALRYRHLVSGINFAGKTILDAGCGMGDLLPYLYAHASDFTYLGVDVTPEFVEIARKRYTGENFEIENPFHSSFARKFNIIFSSGVMNASTSRWTEERKQMIDKLFSLAKEALVFNMAGGFKKISNTPQVAYADSQEIIIYCRQLTTKLSLKADYHPKDFTVTLYK